MLLVSASRSACWRRPFWRADMLRSPAFVDGCCAQTWTVDTLATTPLDSYIRAVRLNLVSFWLTQEGDADVDPDGDMTDADIDPDVDVDPDTDAIDRGSERTVSIDQTDEDDNPWYRNVRRARCHHCCRCQ